MFCGICHETIGACKCPDIDARLAEIRKSRSILLRWCGRCNRHEDRCICIRTVADSAHSQRLPVLGVGAVIGPDGIQFPKQGGES